MRRHAVTFFLTALWSGCTCTGDVTIAPPRVEQGGRAVAIAVSATNEKRLFVATESGGLFRTFDGGVSFQHLDGFPNFAPNDVKIASAAPNIVIATARDDFRTVSGGGIWRSTDDGATWRRPNGWPPPPSRGCPTRPNAFGISHMTLTRTFVVATDCGLAISADDGATFSIMVLDPNAPFRFDSLQNRVRSVLVLNRTVGVAADDTRLWFLQNGQWTVSTVAPNSGNVFGIHAFAAPHWAIHGLFYHVARDGRMWFSTDAGATWTQMQAETQTNREPFIRIGRSLDGDDTHFDIYHGNGFKLRRQTVTAAEPAGTNAWIASVNEANPDPGDVGFDVGLTRPIMLAGDHGVYLTPDSGTTWNLTGGNYGGFVALQIGEVAGRAVVGDNAHVDLYYSTQDNDIKGSPDGGKTWPSSMCCEGAVLRADARNLAAADDPVTGRQCPSCMNYLITPHFASTNSPPPFPNAPNGSPAARADAPLQTVGPTYMQQVPNATPGVFDYFLTHDAGASWAAIFSITNKPRGPAQFAGPLDNPVAYVGIERGGNSPLLSGLIRAQDIASQPSVRRADSTGMGSLGRLLTAQQHYVVFGADPAAPNHLLAPDILDGQMKASSDGGISWYPVPQLTTAVTDTGKFLPQKKEQSFATTIAWDPTNSCHILVGTMQNGVIRSIDGGSTWTRVSGSTAVTYVSSFFFPPTGTIWMSSYGRGLWTISVNRSRPAGGRCAFPPPPGGVFSPDTLVVAPFAGGPARPFGGLTDSAMCATCSLVRVQNGWITDIQLQRDQVQEIAISNGSVVQIRRAGQEIPLTVPNVYREGSGANVRRIAGGAYAPQRRVRAVILNGTQLIAIVLGRDEMPMAAARTPTIVVSSAGASRIPSVAESEDSVSVQGLGFVPGRGAEGVDILFGADTVARGVVVGGDGRFSQTLLLGRGRGDLDVMVQQRDGRRVTMLRSTITVVGRER